MTFSKRFIFEFYLKFVSILTLLFMFGCGKKQKKPFIFEAEKSAFKVNKITLPAVRNVTVSKPDKNNFISICWRNLDPDQKIVANRIAYACAEILLGYHVYRVPQARVIAKEPLTPKPIEQSSFRVKASAQNAHDYYAIRPVFSIQNNIVEGPLSLVVNR